jgi:hypothetical protein
MNINGKYIFWAVVIILLLVLFAYDQHTKNNQLTEALNNCQKERMTPTKKKKTLEERYPTD